MAYYGTMLVFIYFVLLVETLVRDHVLESYGIWYLPLTFVAGAVYATYTYHLSLSLAFVLSGSLFVFAVLIVVAISR